MVMDVLVMLVEIIILVISIGGFINIVCCFLLDKDEWSGWIIYLKGNKSIFNVVV